MLCDVAELLRGAGRMFRLAAHLAHVGLGAPLSDHACQAIAADPAVANLARHVWRVLEDPTQRSSVFRVTRFHRLVHDRRRDQARYVLRTAMRSRWGHVQTVPEPYALRALCVLLRIVHDLGVLPAARLVRSRSRAGGPAA